MQQCCDRKLPSNSSFFIRFQITKIKRKGANKMMPYTNVAQLSIFFCTFLQSHSQYGCTTRWSMCFVLGEGSLIWTGSLYGPPLVLTKYQNIFFTCNSIISFIFSRFLIGFSSFLLCFKWCSHQTNSHKSDSCLNYLTRTESCIKLFWIIVSFSQWFMVAFHWSILGVQVPNINIDRL